MMKHFLSAVLGLSMLFTGCGKPNEQKPDNGKDDIQTPVGPEEVVFSKGADISWVTQYESEGHKFYNSEGKETECTALMKEIGFDAIRLRVWVNPKDLWCGKEDVLVKAKRAQALGMKLMIDFHYSDWWADPGKQNIPAAWANHDITAMTKALSDHTTDVLKTLKDNNIDVEWVQVGNEVNSGMLWPMGKVQDQDAVNFIRLANAGYEATKKIYPEAKVIIHVSNGWDSGLFNWFFGLMKNGGAKYDMIGMSIYPSWWENGAYTTDWKSKIQQCISTMKTMIATYKKPVMICEVGMPCTEPEMSKEALQFLLDYAREVEQCHGVFYWEPESSNTDKRQYALGAFQNGKPTIALDPFKN